MKTQELNNKMKFERNSVLELNNSTLTEIASGSQTIILGIKLWVEIKVVKEILYPMSDK